MEHEIKRLREIEEQKLLLSVMPNLWLNGASVRGYDVELKVDLNNKGETAIFHGVSLISGDIELHDNRTPFEMDKGGQRFISGRVKRNKNVNSCKYEIELKYRDSIQNEYISIIKGQGLNVDKLETKKI